MLHGIKELLGFLAMITPTPPAALTTDEAFNTALRAATVVKAVVKQSTTFPATEVPFRARFSQTLKKTYVNPIIIRENIPNKIPIFVYHTNSLPTH